MITSARELAKTLYSMYLYGMVDVKNGPQTKQKLNYLFCLQACMVINIICFAFVSFVHENTKAHNKNRQTKAGSIYSIAHYQAFKVRPLIIVCQSCYIHFNRNFIYLVQLMQYAYLFAVSSEGFSPPFSVSSEGVSPPFSVSSEGFSPAFSVSSEGFSPAFSVSSEGFPPPSSVSSELLDCFVLSFFYYYCHYCPCSLFLQYHHQSRYIPCLCLLPLC